MSVSRINSFFVGFILKANARHFLKTRYSENVKNYAKFGFLIEKPFLLKFRAVSKLS